MLIRLDRDTVRNFGCSHLEISCNIASQRPEAVLFNRDDILVSEVPKWIRANPAANFPIVVFGCGPQEECDAWLGGPDRYCDASLEDPETFAAAIPRPASYRAWQRQALEAIIAAEERGFRHSFGNRIAAVRILLGAVYARIVTLADGEAILRELSAGLPAANGTTFGTLLAWWLQSQALPGEAPASAALPRLERSILLVDDQAESAGWSRVLGAIFGSGFAAAETCAEARGLLRGRDFDLALIDIELRPPENGIDLIAELRRDRFDMPLIAFTAFDRAEIALPALRAGADVYFVKEVADTDDRESRDYFRRFHKLVSSMPVASDPAREAWRIFQPIEAQLDASEKASRLLNGRYTADFFRMAYYFATAPRADAKGDALVDARHRLFFHEPDLAACQCLHLALRFFVARSLSLNDIRELHVDDELPHLAAWKSLSEGDRAALMQLANANWRHKLHTPDLARLKWFMPPLVRLVGSGFQPAAGLLPELPASPHNLTLGALASHSNRRADAFASLRRAIDNVHPIDTDASLLIVDDEPKDWERLLHHFWRGEVRTTRPDSGALATLEHLLCAGPDNRVVLLDLDWRGDGGVAAQDLLQRVKHKRPWQPILVASAMSDSLSVQRALYNGASAYFLLGPRTNANDLTTVFTRMARLANYPLARFWAQMESLKPELERVVPFQADLCLDTLKLALYCWWPDSNPAEIWRDRRLAGIEDGWNSEMLRRMFFSLAFRAQEGLWREKPEKNEDYGRALSARNSGNYAASLRHRAPSEEIEQLERVFRLIPQALAAAKADQKAGA